MRALRSLAQDIRGVGGSLADLASLARSRFVHPHSYTKFMIIRAVARRTGARTFVEAGTFRGVNAERCCRVFDRVLTVELDPELARAAQVRLAEWKSCTVVQGDAAQAVPALVAKPDLTDILLLLDAHPCGAGTAAGDVTDPAIPILEQLEPLHAKIRAILIDDFRLFGSEPGYPEKWQVLRAAEELFAPHGYRIDVFFDQLLIEKSELAKQEP